MRCLGWVGCLLVLGWMGCGEPSPAADLGTTDASVCASASLACGGDCVDPSSSLAHCGGCDRACGPLEQCQSGRCTSDPTGGLTVTMVGPQTGYENGGAWLTVFGTGFANPIRAYVGGARAPAIALDDTHARVLTPPGVKGLVDVHVEVAGKRATLPRGFAYDQFGLSTEWKKVMMSQARGGYPGLAVLQSGRVLIFGGTADSTAGSASNTADLYDPTSKSATLVASTMATRRFVTSGVVLLDGRVLIVGACNLPTGDPSCPVSDGTIADLYDPATSSFRPDAPKLVEKTRVAARPTLLSDGRVLVTSPGSPTAEVFDPASSTFAMLPIGSSNAGFGIPVRLRDGRILFVAAQGAKSEIYDPDTGVLKTLSATFEHSPQSVHLLPDGHVISVAGGDLVGGDLTPHGAIQLFDPTTETFVTAAKSLQPGRTASASLLASDGTLLVAGGQTSTYGLSTTGCDHVFPLLASVDVVDPYAGFVKSIAPLPESNFELRGVSIFDGSLILVGGSQCGGAVSIPFVYFLESAPVL